MSRSKAGRIFGPDIAGISRRLLAVMLALSLAVAGTAGAYASSAFGPHLRTLDGVSDVTAARFISPDTMDPTLPGVGTNRYSYGENDPINKSDPSGHICIPCGIGIVVGALSSLFSGTGEANAPGPNDEVEEVPEAQTLTNMAIGAVPGKPVEQLAAGAARHFGSRITVWSMLPVARGFAIEAKLGANLSAGFRTIDSWDPKRGVARSIKSIDLNSKAYRDPKKLESTIAGHIRDIGKFKGATGYNRQGQPISISPGSIRKKELEIAIPGRPDKNQQIAIDRMIERGKAEGVDVKMTRVD